VEVVGEVDAVGGVDSPGAGVDLDIFISSVIHQLSWEGVMICFFGGDTYHETSSDTNPAVTTVRWDIYMFIFYYGRHTGGIARDLSEL
jgi:hypothetical protein